MKVIKVVVAILSVVLLALSILLGILLNYLFLFLVVSAVIAVVFTIVSIVKKKLAWDYSDVKVIRSYAMIGVFRNATWIIIGLCVHIAMVPIQFAPGAFTKNLIFLWGSVVTLCIYEWIPVKRAGKSINIALAIFSGCLTVQLGMIYTSPRSDSVR